MANTYSQILLHIVFAVKNTNSLMPAIFQPRIHAYIGGVLREKGHYAYCVGGVDSHVHMLVGYNPNQSVPDMVRDVKSATSRFINDGHLIPFKFEWQAGYGCFSNSYSQINDVCRYIRNQTEHHKHTTLEDEMRHILDQIKLDYDCRYIIKDPEG